MSCQSNGQGFSHERLPASEELLLRAGRKPPTNTYISIAAVSFFLFLFVRSCHRLLSLIETPPWGLQRERGEARRACVCG